MFCALIMCFVLLVVAAPALATAPSQDRSAASEDDSPFRLTATEAGFVKAINSYREKYDLPALEPDATLFHVARARVPYLDANRPGGAGVHNHHALGMWCWEHASRDGFPGWASDNLAMGCLSPEEAVDAWGSEDNDAHPAGHNFQMRGLFNMNGRWQNYRYNRVGVAMSGNRYIAIFGRREQPEQKE